MDKVSSVDLERASYLKAFSDICAAYIFNFFSTRLSVIRFSI